MMQTTDFFPGFKTEEISTSGATIHTVYGGNPRGSPLLLLHGRGPTPLAQPSVVSL